MRFEIPIFKFLVKPLLWFFQFVNEHNFILVCKGYNDDFNLFTGIYWQDDSKNCLNYENYKIWINLKLEKLWQ